MDAKILGPLTVRVGAASATPTARKPRQLLALLLLNANHMVPVAKLVEGLWGDEPPASATSTLQTYVLQLRKRFARALDPPDRELAKRTIVTMDGGYMFVASAGVLDLHAYQEAARLGAQALRVGEHERAARLLHQALGLWRDEALVDVRRSRVLAGEVARLEESRLRTLEQRLEVDLILGRHHELVEELSYLSQRYPLHENLHYLYMTALFRSGRRIDALDVFRRVWVEMTGEWGIEPAAKLQELQRSILSADKPVLPAPHASLAG